MNGRFFREFAGATTESGERDAPGALGVTTFEFTGSSHIDEEPITPQG